MSPVVAWLDKEAWNAVREARAMSRRSSRLWNVAALGPFACAFVAYLLGCRQ